MQNELFLRMAKAGIEAEWAAILRDLEALEWAAILRDLEALTEVEIENGGRRFLVRSRARGLNRRHPALRRRAAADHHTPDRRRAGGRFLNAD